MIMFLLFLELLGVGVVLLGFVSTFIMGFIPISETIKLIVGLALMTSFCYLYIFTLNKFFLKLYQNMKCTFKVFGLKEKIVLRLSLLSLMLFHFYSLVWLKGQMDNIFHYIVIVLFLSFFLGLAIKGIFDESYKIKVSRETEKLIYNR